MAEKRALLVTDLVDSTKLAEALGDEAAAALGARHDRVARDLLAHHDGLEIDKTDGFLLLFVSAASAVAYAVAYHQALAGLGLRARAGLHVGEVVLRENPPADVRRGAKPLEVEGVAKALAARVMSVAVGGQTLATAAAVQAAGDVVGRRGDAAGRASVLGVSHGHWQLKGVARPVELVELGVEGVSAFAPPPDAAKAWRVVAQGDLWVPVREVRHGLPAERDTFIGREADLQALARCLDDGARLVTVLGMGGTGKTRVATRFAWTWLGEYPGGAWFCDLSEARSPEGILQAMSAALDVPLGKGDGAAQIGHAIAARGPCLVVLDNFEQVARYAAETLGRWLDRTRSARFVVTTREVLGLPGETTLALAPLETEDGVDLFVARATQAKRDFVLAEEDRADVQALVKLLDGLPLAIELAAARVRVMPPRLLLQRMSERFKLLASSGGRHTRQATLRATFDWSWGLLSPDERHALAQLSVFEGGFTLEAAERVLALDELWPTDAVQALVDRSWVRSVSSTRFDVLVSVQEYASERLDGFDGRAAAEQRHGAAFARFGTPDAIRALFVHGGRERRAALEADLENVLAACRRAIGRADAEASVWALEAAWAVLSLRGPAEVGAALADALVALELPPALRAQAHLTRGSALHLAGRTEEALASFEVVRALLPALGDSSIEGMLSSALGNLYFELGRRDDSRHQYEAALRAHRARGERRSEGIALGNLGIVCLDEGRADAAREAFENALDLARQVGDLRLEGTLVGNLGNALLALARPTEALARYEEALPIAHAIGNRRLEAVVLGNLGFLHEEAGRPEAALRCYTQALAMHREVGNRRFEGHTMSTLGELLLAEGRVAEARAVLEPALALLVDIGEARHGSLTRARVGRVHQLQGEPERALAEMTQGLAEARSGRHRSNEARVLLMLTELHLEQGRLGDARACVDEAEALLRDLPERSLLGRVLCLRARLAGPEARGAALDEAEALAIEVGAGPASLLGRAIAAARSVPAAS